MDKRYEVFCLADRHFYETPERLAAVREQAGPPEFEPALRPAPEGWRRSRKGDWLHLRPSGAPGPAQGWKIHVSACLDNADKTAAKLWDYCVPRGIPFKFVPSARELFLRNSKYADRGGSGKFATVYPGDEEQLHTVLRELDEVLAGEPGPYILTDLRWNDGPLYVRYGAFAPRYCADATGALVPAIEDDRGRLIPDRRDPVFQVPSWVRLPAFLEPQLAARAATTVADLPYRIEGALHFSNGGGVYSGTDTRTGDQVVLKEARPYAGLAADGADAVTRLEREKTALERLAGLDVVPAVRDWLDIGGHRFLVMDFLPGRTLNAFFAERHPLIASRPDPEAVADYTRWALRLHRAVEEAVAAVHARGVVIGDLHMFNIMVAPDEKSVALLDFEAAAPAEDGARQTVAHPGFVAPPDRTGFAIDRYALACLRLALFLPLTTLLAIDRSKAAHLAALVQGHFPDVPRKWLAEAVAEIEDGAPAAAPPADLPQVADWPRSRDAMAAAILASATPERDDRLFPGDIAQFADGGGLGIAHGAAGVLYALAVTGADRYEEGEQWLLRHAAEPPRGTPLGLYDGLLGAAYVLDGLGHTDAALEITDRVLREKWDRLGIGLHSGLAGAGLVLDHLARHDAALHEHADDVVRLTARRLTAAPPDRTGLLHGATGAALLFIRRHERTGDPALLDAAATALRTDLARCVHRPDGTLVVDDRTRTLPYTGAGSVGIAMVLDDYLAQRDDPEFETARAAILPAACSRFYAQPGLFRGRAGMVLHLARTTTPGECPAAELPVQLAALDWYAMRHGSGLAFPGDQMMRLSHDLATGTAGCLLAAGAALHPEPVGLPFLPPPRPRDHEPAPDPES
ncbi:class III lanthionine synthetase LanKC [Streptomyces sp. NPDC001796]|uniref:class III lanthionine synthetase LanKC n=1 Tax=Streptomyces sp. NPDC001796 TaxID=3364609 RepID=UPI0036984B04